MMDRRAFIVGSVTLLAARLTAARPEAPLGRSDSGRRPWRYRLAQRGTSHGFWKR